MEQQELSFSNSTLSPVDSTKIDLNVPEIGDEFKVEPIDSSEKNGLVDVNQICRGCLNITELKKMQDIYFDNMSCIELYEDILKIKVESESIPSLMCSNCLTNLNTIYNFIKMLRNSHLLLEEATKAIKLIDNRTTDSISSDYNLKVSNILRQVLQINTQQIPMELCNNFNKSGILKENNVSDCRDSESSDDDTPLSEKLRLLNERQSKNRSSKLRKVSGKSDLPKKRGRPKKGTGQENHPSSELGSNKKTDEYFAEENTCQLCFKSFRNLSLHLQNVHYLDWEHLKCLKCLVHEKDKDKLMGHSLSCFKVENDYISEPDAGNDMDPDFEPDQPEGIESSSDEDIVDDSPIEEGQHKKRQRKYACNICEGASFSKYDQIETHLKFVHSNESKCILCTLQFNNSFSLLYHMMVKHGKLKCCRLCLISFKNSEELNTHYKSDQHNTKCTVCGEQFKNRKAVYEHRRKKHLNPQPENQKFKCPECPREFANSNNIRRHILVAHNDLRFLCDTCGQSYTTKRNLTIHIQKFHQGIQVETKSMKKNFFCESCGRELRIFHKYAIALHRAKHKGHSHVCKKCYDSFATDEEFKRHVKESGHQLFECDKCQSQFVREENFKIHLKNHDAPGWNKNMFATWGKSAKLRNDKGEFVCSYCPKVFKDKQRLDNHVRVHTNERPYKCHICSKGFKTWIHRKTHLNIHLGIKKWTCKYCSKAFTNSCTLKGHEMIHTGERPHRCPECRKGFITMSAMKKHRMIHFKGGAAYDADKIKTSNERVEEKQEMQEERSTNYLYKYDTMFTGSDASYEGFNDPPKSSVISLGPIEKQLQC